jgi:hypothetical protein
MPRQLLVTLVWGVALVLVVVAIGLQVRKGRMQDPAQAMRAWLTYVPSDTLAIARMLSRDDREGRAAIQIELRAAPAWVRAFARGNGFVPSEGTLEGLVAERWVLLQPRRPGMVHLLLPGDGSPALLTIAPEAVSDPRR